jgi:hypothetical protein
MKKEGALAAMPTRWLSGMRTIIENGNESTMKNVKNVAIILARSLNAPLWRRGASHFACDTLTISRFCEMAEIFHASEVNLGANSKRSS